MGKRSKLDEEEDYSSQNSGSEQAPPPTKRSKKTEKKSQKKVDKSKSTTKEPSSSEPSSKKGSVAKAKNGNALLLLFVLRFSPRLALVFTNAEGDEFIDLGKKRRATVRSFKGSILIDIREFYGTGDDLAPGKKGISLSVDQWEELKANADTIDNLIQKLK